MTMADTHTPMLLSSDDDTTTAAALTSAARADAGGVFHFDTGVGAGGADAAI